MSLGDWDLSVTGRLARIDREDLDKSGRNPKYMLSLVIEPDQPPDVPEGVMLPSELAVRIKGSELPALIHHELSPGDLVELTARANGPRPATLKLIAIRHLVPSAD